MDPECVMPIYQVGEDEYVKCQVYGAKWGFFGLLGIIIVVLILMIFLESSTTAIVVTLFLSILIIAASGFYAFGYAADYARRDHRAAQMRLDSYVDSGMTRAEAVKMVQSEEFQRQQLAATNRGMRSQNLSMLASADILANAIRRN